MYENQLVVLEILPTLI